MGTANIFAVPWVSPVCTAQWRAADSPTLRTRRKIIIINEVFLRGISKIGLTESPDNSLFLLHLQQLSASHSRSTIFWSYMYHCWLMLPILKIGEIKSSNYCRCVYAVIFAADDEVEQFAVMQSLEKWLCAVAVPYKECKEIMQCPAEENFDSGSSLTKGNTRNCFLRPTVRSKRSGLAHSGLDRIRSGPVRPDFPYV